MPAEGSAFSRGKLSVRPGGHVAAAGELGQLKLAVDGAEVGLLHVPASYVPSVAAPLVVMLHGAGDTAQHSVDLVKSHADRTTRACVCRS